MKMHILVTRVLLMVTTENAFFNNEKELTALSSWSFRFHSLKLWNSIGILYCPELNENVYQKRELNKNGQKATKN